ncbi:MAG: response regulator [Hyphomonadaceae bacterium]
MQRNLKSELTFNFANASVAMIDASPICIEVLTGILSGCGFRRMYRCSDLRIGSDTIKTHSLDLILIDPYAFGEEAYKFVRWLRSDQRALNSGASIIIVTAYTRVHLISAARQCGADYVIAKPFSTAGLLERILWVAESERRHGELLAPPELVSSSGSGMEMW